MPKGRPRGTFRAKIELPDGRIVTGWAVAAEALGRRSLPSLKALAEYDECRRVYTLNVPPPQTARVRVGGCVVEGWQAALEATGRRSSGSLRARAVKGDDGVYELEARDGG